MQIKRRETAPRHLCHFFSCRQTFILHSRDSNLGEGRRFPLARSANIITRLFHDGIFVAAKKASSQFCLLHLMSAQWRCFGSSKVFRPLLYYAVCPSRRFPRKRLFFSAFLHLAHRIFY